MNMGLTRQYQTYYAISLKHWQEVWGGNTYNTLLVKEHPSEDLVSDDFILSDEVSFIYPLMYESKYYLDGIIEGFIGIYNNHSTTTATITSYTVTLKKQANTDPSPSTLATMTRTLTANNTIPPKDYIFLPLFMPVEHQKVDVSEKLILTISFVSTGGTCGVACANDSSVLDNLIKLPYALTD